MNFLAFAIYKFEVLIFSPCQCESALFFIIIFLDVVDEDTHLALAHHMYKAGNYNEALEHSKCVYDRNPTRTDNLLLLGAIYYQVLLVSEPLDMSSFAYCC